MDKSKLLNEYMKKIYNDMDKIREVYPKAMSIEIIQMEKGYRLCATKSAEWIEQMLNIIDVSTDVIQGAVAKNIYQTDLLSTPTSLVLPAPLDTKKKKSFLQVASEAAKDMGRDVFNANQMDMKGDKK